MKALIENGKIVDIKLSDKSQQELKDLKKKLFSSHTCERGNK
jgi:hypothetical protein